MKRSRVFLDFETFLIQPACLAPPIVAMVYAYDEEPPRILHAKAPSFDRVLEDFLMSDVVLVAHYASFEMLVMMAANADCIPSLFAKLRKGQVHCTLVREKLIRIAKGDNTDGFGLGDCCAYWKLPIQLDKKDKWRLRYGELYDVPVDQWPVEARDYLLGDIAVRDVYWAQETAPAEWLQDQSRQVAKGLSLALSSAWGFQTDRARAEILVSDTEMLLEKDRDTLVAAGLVRAKVKRGVAEYTKDIKAATWRMEDVCASVGRAVPRGEITDKMAAKGHNLGNVKLDAEACKNSGDELLKSYTRYSKAGTLLSKARRLLHSPIQCSYNVLVATGRTSCRQGDDPKPGEAWSSYGMQLQNLPRVPGVRECFVPRPGHAIVSIDFDQFELRTWAQVCTWLFGFSDQGEVLKDPSRCLHLEMAAFVNKMKNEDAYGMKKSDPGLYKKMRQLGKSVNFGAPGGLGAERFVDFARGTYGVLDVDVPRAREILQAWRDMWREADLYLKHISGMLKGRGSVTTIKHFLSQRYRGRVGYCDAANSYFQGLAADAAGAGLVDLMYAMYEPGANPAVYGLRMLAFVHDEVLLEVPLDRLHEAAYAARDVFVAGAQVFCPDIPLTASPAAALRWSKSAGDPVHKDGKLIVYEEREEAAR